MSSADDAIIEGPSFEVEAQANHVEPEVVDHAAPPPQQFRPVVPPPPIVKQPKEPKPIKYDASLV